MNKQNSEQLLAAQLSDLPKELTPKRDLWLGIEKGIHNKTQLEVSNKAKNQYVPLSWAASVVFAVLLTWGVISPQQADSPAELVVEMQQNFEQQKQAMLVTYGQPKLADLPESLKKQLEDLASARKSIENALLEDPANNDLLNILRWTQAQELELLTKLFSPQWQSI